MAEPGGDEHDVERVALADDLVRDVRIALLGVLRLWHHSQDDTPGRSARVKSCLHRCAQATLAQDLRAALRPGVPITPPPGWAAAPQIEAGDRRPVARAAGHGTEREELPGVIAPWKMLPPVRLKTLEVRRREHLAVEDRALEVRRVRVEQVEAAVRERLTVVVPGSVASSYGRTGRTSTSDGGRAARPSGRPPRGSCTRGRLCGGAPVLGVVEARSM